MPPVDASLLDRFVPMNALAAEERAQIAGTARLLQLAPGKAIDSTTLADSQTLYLVEGDVVLDTDGTLEAVCAGTPRAALALTRRGVRGAQIRATTASRLLQVDRHLVSTCMVWAGSASTDGSAQETMLTPEMLRIGLLRRIPTANLLRLGTLFDRVAVEAGDTVIRQGESGEHYFLVRSGEFAVSRQSDPDSCPVTLAELHAGDSFGEEALISDMPRNATITACCDGVLLRLTKDNFQELIRDPLLHYVNRAEAERRVAAGAHWLDVRLAEEFAVDGPAGGLNIPLGELRERSAELDASGEYVVCSSSGRRSAAAAFLLSGRGIATVALAHGLHAGKTLSPADDEAIRLPSELARANAELETRLHASAEARTASRYPDSAVALTHETLDEQLAQATAALARAQRRKLEIESRLRESEAAALARRRETDEACERLRRQANDRLRAEEQRLQTEYARASRETERLRVEREAAEQRFANERAELETRLARSRETLQDQALQVRESVAKIKTLSSEKSERIRAEYQAAEARLRHETEARLQAERQRLENALRESVAEQERARRALTEMDDTREAARREAQRLEAELAAAAIARRAAEEQARESERADLVSRYARASDALERAEARAAQEPSAIASEISATSRRDDAEIPVSTESDVDEARQALDSAARARSVMEKRVAARATVEQEIRVQLINEAEDWMVAERARAKRELERARIEAEEIERIEGRKAEAKRKARETTDSIMSDVSSQLGDEHDSSGGEASLERLIQLRALEEKAVLTAKALEKNAEKRAAAEAALARIRTEIKSLESDVPVQ